MSYNRVGDVLVAQGNLPEALKSFRDSLAIADRLAKRLTTAGKGRGATRAERREAATLRSNILAAIRDRLAKADPGNSGWRRDLALSHGRVATVLARHGSRREAVHAFEQGRAIIVRLRQQSPDNATLPKDLAWFEAEIAALNKK